MKKRLDAFYGKDIVDVAIMAVGTDAHRVINFIKTQGLAEGY